MPDAEPATDADSPDRLTGAADGLLSPTELRALAGRLGVRPTKGLGQNFLLDANTVRRIVRLAEVGPEDVVLEVGPGLGSLTLALAGVARRVVAVEIDAALAAALTDTVSARVPHADLSVVVGDAVRLPALPGPPPTAFVANLPYNVAVPVLLGVLERLPSVQRGLVMVQREVADRLVAPPGSRVYGVPSVKLAWWAASRRAATIPRSVFWPVPNVDSALVAFERREPPGDEALRVRTFAAIDAAFSQRRKTLRGALSQWVGSAARAEALLRRADVDPGLRGEALDVTAFARLGAAYDGGA